MKKTRLHRIAAAVLLSACCACLFAGQTDLSWTAKIETARGLLYFFDCRGVVMNEKQLKEMISEPDGASARVFRRILEKRGKEENEKAYLRKEPRAKSTQYSFDATEVREAALAEMLSLGPDAVPLLLECVHSEREDIQLGVLRSLSGHENPELLKVYATVLSRDKWGGSEFPLSCMDEAARSLCKYLPAPEAQTLLRSALRDNDQEISMAALEGVEKCPQSGREVLVSELVSAYEYRLGQWLDKGDPDSPKKAEDDAGRAIPIAKLLRAVLSQDGDGPAKIKIPDELFRETLVAAVLLDHERKLDRGMRTELLSRLLESPDISLQTRALDKLNKEDREKFTPAVAGLLRNSRDLCVLEKCLGLARDWKLSASRADVERLAKTEAGHLERIRAMASEVLRTL